MNWKNIVVAPDNTHFLLDGKLIFDKQFIEVLKFHTPGIAPVKDASGAYHIDASGNELYHYRYSRTFGFYCNRAAVIDGDRWLHINIQGERAYAHTFAWTGNFQEDICIVRNAQNHYFHIDLTGTRIYTDNYIYAGDFKDGIACVKLRNGFYRHIDSTGKFAHDKAFWDLGVFHKNFATAKDQKGWFHIDKNGCQLYSNRYLAVEPFYNGFALVTAFDNAKQIIDEQGFIILDV